MTGGWGYGVLAVVLLLEIDIGGGDKGRSIAINGNSPLVHSANTAVQVSHPWDSLKQSQTDITTEVYIRQRDLVYVLQMCFFSKIDHIRGRTVI